jgi:hypothetical protein
LSGVGQHGFEPTALAGVELFVRVEGVGGGFVLGGERRRVDQAVADRAEQPRNVAAMVRLSRLLADGDLIAAQEALMRLVAQ